MNFIAHLFSEALVHALGWTLLHSLWQAALIALVLGLLLVLLQRHAASLRYNIAGGALVLQLLFSFITFGWYYSTAPVAQAAAIPFASEAAAADHYFIAPAALSLTEAGPLTLANQYFDQHLPLVVTVWLMGMLVMLLRFLGGLAYTQRLRHHRTTPLGEHWQQKLVVLSEAIGVRKAVQLAESALVQVPLTIGYLKPVILLPVGAVTGLSQAQVEAILAHELAHILRKDYLLNLLQSVADVLFFYHPAMWWMSGVVRAEREHCCDDLAVALCGNPLTYARALAELEAMRLPAAPAMALAIAGKNGSLLHRIKRLVNKPALRPTFSEGFVAALVLVAGLLVLSVGAMASFKPTTPETVLFTEEITIKAPAATKVPPATLPDTTAETTSAFVYTVQDGTGKADDVVIIKNKKGEVTELYVNGRRIPKKDIEAYTTLLNQRLEATQKAPKATRQEVAAAMEAARGAAEKARQQNQERVYTYRYRMLEGDSMNFRVEMPPFPPVPPVPVVVPALPPMPPMPPVAPLPPGATEQQKKEYQQQKDAYEQEMKQYQEDMKQFQEDAAYYQQQTGKPLRGHRAVREPQALRAVVIDQEQVIRMREQATRQHNLSMERHGEALKKHEEGMKHREEITKQLESVKKELVKDGLLQENAQKIDLKIDDKGMYIDGKAQPEAVHQKYRNMLKTKDGKNLNFHILDNKSSSVIIE